MGEGGSVIEMLNFIGENLKLTNSVVKSKIMSKRATVSFLLGSGFSIPEGLPSVSQLNNRLAKINESEILIHSDQRAIFLNGAEDPNRWQRRDERLFLQEFLEFYNDVILK